MQEVGVVLAEALDTGLIFKTVKHFLEDGKEVDYFAEDQGRRYVVEGKLLPQPHIEITPIDN